jgi:hypothetical protein
VAKSSPKNESPLVRAAAALDEELRRYDALADEAKQVQISSGKALERAAKIVQESTSRNDALQEKLRELVAQIEAARGRQVESLGVLLEAARRTQARSEQYDAILQRFSALGESARGVSAQAAEASSKRGEGSEGATEAEARASLAAMEVSMAGVVAEAEALTALAADQGWDDLKSQADGVRQQVLALKSKLTAARLRSASGAN